MKKMIVCGCSFMHPDFSPEFNGTHFSEIIAKDLGYELILNSFPGSSNGGICIQLEDAINQQPDLILFGQSLPDRIELNVSDEPFDYDNYHIYDTKLVELKDLVRYGSNPNIISENLYGLLSEPNFLICSFPHKTKNWRKERHDALKKWFMYLYSPTMKRQIDVWCLYAVQHKLKVSGIPAIKVIDLLDYDTPWYDCVTKNTYKFNNQHSLGDPPDEFARYHTTKNRQIDIANIIKKRMREMKIL